MPLEPQASDSAGGSENDRIRIALIQTRCGPDPERNLAATIERIEAAAARGAQVVCLQELFLRPYPCQEESYEPFQQAEPVPGPTTQRLAELARRLNLVIIGSLFEKRAEGLFHNTAVVLDADGSLAGKYRKMHIPDDPHYYEKFYFTPGDLGFSAAATRFGRIGVCVCWDQWFPEAARLTALQGADFLFYPTAIGWLDQDRETCGAEQVGAWKTMMRSHAIANGVFVAAANRVGREDQIEFWGGSFVADPYGSVIAEGSQEEETTVYADCRRSLIGSARTHWPFLRDRRIDAYGGLLNRFGEDGRES